MLRHTIKRLYSTNPSEYNLKCGLEIHSQLNTKNKLFSLSPTSFNQLPNSKISYFDASLPGTQPKLNQQALLYALKAATALECDINLNSSFDRKHYFYGDQPLGYQITQHYSPIAKNGSLKLFKNDGIRASEKVINIEQIQLEQDTGKSIYQDFDDDDSYSKIDLNRANIPLIELVTRPDFEDSQQVKVFIKKFQNLLRHLDICTGDLETGAMRIDVNISVNNNNRVELKNLSTTSAVISAIKYEYNRQLGLIKSGKEAELIQETRGWDGSKTVRLRSKENSLDYRYFPDPELPSINLDQSIISEMKDFLPELPDYIMNKLMKKPYGLNLKDSTILTYDLTLLKYYFELFEETVVKNQFKDNKLPSNWLINELLGEFSKKNLKFDPELISVSKFAELLKLINDNKLSKSSGKLLLQHIFNNDEDRLTKTLDEIIEEYDLAKTDNVNESEIEEICNEVISQNEKVIKTLSKKPNGLKFLVGRAMSLTQGKIDAKTFEAKFKELLKL